MQHFMQQQHALIASYALPSLQVNHFFLFLFLFILNCCHSFLFLGMEGVSRNVVVGGFESGSIRIWDAWDLNFLCELKEGGHTSPVTGNTHLILI